MLGHEVMCGNGYADLIAVELDAARPVLIEVKMAANTDRRQALTQVLGYAAYLRRLDYAGLEARVAPHLSKAGLESVAAAAAAAAADVPLDASEFETALRDSMKDGRLRCVIVLDRAPVDLIELVGYLQDVSNDKLALDLITVTAYKVGDRRVLVPQLVEPDRSQVTAAAAGGSPPAQTAFVEGSARFEEAIPEAPDESQEPLRELLSWARDLERDGLAELWTYIGKGRWVLNIQLPGQRRSMVVVWNDHGASLSPYRTVLQKVAPRALGNLEARSVHVRQGNTLKPPFDGDLLNIFRAAYEEANGKTGSAEPTPADTSDLGGSD
jgi:hypothetical protein